MAAIQVSGFNNIDFGALADAIVASERAPLTNLETSKTNLETKNTAFGTLASKLSTLQTAFQNLGKSTSMAGLSVSSSDGGVGVSAGTGNVGGTYDVVVSQLAKQQVTASTSTYGSSDDIVATGGTLVLRDSQGNDSVITVTGPLKLSELAAAINAKDTAPVNASVVQTSPGTYQLVLTGRATGAAGSFSVGVAAGASGQVTSLTGGAGITFTNFDQDGFAGDSVEDNKQQAQNALFKVNSLDVSSAGNVVNDVVPGATLTLTKADPTKTVTVQVSRDSSQGSATIDKLVSAYNDLLSFLDTQRTNEIAGKAGISRDPLVRSLRDNMRAAFMAQYTGTGSFTRLAEIGLGFDRSGKLTLDKTIYNAAMKDKPADVQSLFSTQGTAGKGAFGALETLIDSYTESGGLVSDMRERITEQVKSMTTRIDAMDHQLQQRREALMAEYNAADRTMSLLKNQSSTLSTLSSTYRLF